MGKMDEIKELLQSGKTVKEIKELGYKAPSIYKVKKQMKDIPVESEENGTEEIKPFQKENEEVPGTILDNNSPGPNNSDSSSNNILDNQETKENNEDSEPLTEEIFSDDDKPFHEFDEVDINRTHVNVSSTSGLFKSETKTSDQSTGKLGVAELIAQVYSLIGITTGHDHWDVSPKEQKVLKHLCKIPVLEVALHKFGLYGCVISLITMTLKRIKIEMQLKKESQEIENENHEEKLTVNMRPDSPGTVMGLLEQ